MDPMKHKIKGGLFIAQLSKLAEKFSEHTGASSAIEITVWCHPCNPSVNVEFKVWDSKKSTHYKPIGKHNDIRKIEALIDQIIADDIEGGD
jgi:hypothetical protein